MMLRVLAHRGLKGALSPEDRPAGLAGREMPLDGKRAFQVELAVEIRMKAAAGLGAIHVRTPALRAAGAATGACALARGATSPCRGECRRSRRSPCTKDPRAREAR